jgi:hypothetical protein
MLLTLAVVTIAVGLFVWLGGLGFKKTMYTIAGACVGAFCTLLMSGHNIPMAAAVVGICAVLAFTMQENFLMLVASAVAAVIGYSFFIRPYYRPSGNLLAVIRQITVAVPYYNWPMLLAVTALPFAAVSWKSASALFSSAAGTIIILAGTVMIFLDFGYPAIGYMTSERDMYIGVIALTTIVGIFVQLLLLPKISSRFAAAKQAVKFKVKKGRIQKGDDEVVEKAVTWRTS